MSGPIGGYGGTGPLRGTGKLNEPPKLADTPAVQDANALQRTPSSTLVLSSRGDTAETLALKQSIAQLVPGASFKATDSIWGAKDLQALKQVLGAMSAADRSQLTGTEFIKAKAHTSNGKPDTVGGEATVADDGSRHVTLYDTAYDPKLQPAGFKGNPAAEVLAHEMGHVVQTFERERVTEFARLGWTVDPAAHAKDPTWDPQRDDAFVWVYNGNQNYTDFLRPKEPAISTIGKQSPTEDFAESFRLYTNDPAALMKQSPERFLFLNGESRAYSPDRVAALGKQTGVNLQAVLTRLATNKDIDLKQDTIEHMVQGNGIGLDRIAVIKSADAQLQNGDALGKAIALISKKIVGGDAAFEKQLLANPALALKDFWGKLSAVDQQQLKANLPEMVKELKLGAASPTSLLDDVRHDVQQAGVKEFFRMALDPKDDRLRKAMASQDRGKLEQALRDTGLLTKLPPTVVDSLIGSTSTDNRARLATIVSGASFKNLMAKPENVKQFIEQVTVMDALAFFDKLEGLGNVKAVKPNQGIFGRIGNFFRSAAETVGAAINRVTRPLGLDLFKNDKHVLEANQQLDQLAAGNMSFDKRGHATIMI